MNKFLNEIYNRHDNIIHLLIEALLIGILFIMIEVKVSHINTKL
jgi:hypothetical protein